MVAWVSGGLAAWLMRWLAGWNAGWMDAEFVIRCLPACAALQCRRLYAKRCSEYTIVFFSLDQDLGDEIGGYMQSVVLRFPLFSLDRDLVVK